MVFKIKTELTSKPEAPGRDVHAPAASGRSVLRLSASLSCCAVLARFDAARHGQAGIVLQRAVVLSGVTHREAHVHAALPRPVERLHAQTL